MLLAEDRLAAEVLLEAVPVAVVACDTSETAFEGEAILAAASHLQPAARHVRLAPAPTAGGVAWSDAASVPAATSPRLDPRDTSALQHLVREVQAAPRDWYTELDGDAEEHPVDLAVRAHLSLGGGHDTDRALSEAHGALGPLLGAGALRAAFVAYDDALQRVHERRCAAYFNVGVEHGRRHARPE